MHEFKCPKCGDETVKRIVHSRGIVVCMENYLALMWELQKDADAGNRSHRDLGYVEAVISMDPLDEEKYAFCNYCSKCNLLILRQADRIPSDQVPAVAK
jgi:hypothetical protein